MNLNNRNFADDEQDFDYIVGYHETPDTNLERDPLQMAEELHNHVQTYLKDQFKNWARDYLPEEAKDFSEWALDFIDLSEGE